MIKKNLVSNYIGQLWVALMGFIFIPKYISYIGIEAYGLIGVFAVLQTCINMLDLGIKTSLGRELAKFSGGGHAKEYVLDLMKSVEIIIYSMGAAFLLITYTVVNYLSSGWLKFSTLPESVITNSMFIMGLVVVLRFIEGFYSSTIAGLQHHTYLNLINIGMATLRGLGAVLILAMISPTIEAFFLWQALISVFSLILLRLKAKSLLPNLNGRRNFSPKILRNLIDFAGGVILVSIFSILLNQVDKILLTKLVSLSEFGYYTFATITSGTVLILSSPVTNTLFPKLVELNTAGNHAEFIIRYHQGAQIISSLLGSASLFLIFNAKDFLYLWTNDITLALNVAPIVILLTIGNLFIGLNAMPVIAQYSQGWTGLSVRLHGIASLTVIPCYFLVVPQFGIVGAAWIWAIMNFCYVIISTYFMHKKILKAEKLKWVLNDVIIPISGGLLASIVLKILLPKPQDIWSSLLTLLFSAIIITLSSVLASKEIKKILNNFLNDFKKILPKI